MYKVTTLISKYFLIVLLLSQFQISAYSQGYNNFLFKQYSKNNNLPSSSCSGIYKDNYGFLWIANAYGIVTYNGREFFTHSLYTEKKDFYLGDSPQYFLQLDSNRLLITATNGLFIFFYNSKKIEPLNIPLKKKPEGKIEIIGFNQAHDQIIIKTWGNIYFFTLAMQLIRQISCVNESSDIHIRNQITSPSCFYYTRNGNLVSINTETGTFDSTLHMPGVKSVIINGQHPDVYTIATAYNVLQIDKKSKRLIKTTPMPGQKEPGIDFFPRAVTQDNSGNYWIGGESNLFVYNPSQSNISELDGLVSNFSTKKINSYAISDVWIDKESTFVTSYSGGGLFEYKKGFSNFKDFYLPENLNAGTFSMTIHGDYILGANDVNGLYKFELKKKKSSYKYYPVSQNDGSILQIEQLDDKNIWVLFNENFKVGIIDLETLTIKPGLSAINNMTLQYFNSSSNFRLLNRDYRPIIKKTMDGSFYITVGKSLYRITGDPTQGFQFNFIDSIASPGYISCISGSRQFIIGTTKGELFRLEKDKLVRKTIALNDFFLPAKSIDMDSRGNSYLMTTNGVFVYDSSFRLKKHLLKPITAFEDHKIYSGKMDNRDILWMASSSWIIAYNTITEQVTNYPCEEVTRNWRFKTKAVAFDNDWVYFGGAEGITGVDTRLENTDTTQCTLYFDEIKNGNTVLYRGLTPGSVVAKLPFSYDSNSFTLSFKSISYQQATGIHYKYKLEGFDNNWNFIDDGKKLNFLSLPAGSYKLVIEEMFPDDRPCSAISYSFIIMQPFWKTAWFFILAATIVTALILLIAAFIIRKKLEVQKIKTSLQIALKSERERISRDLHDDLGSGLTSIKLLSNVILAKKENINTLRMLEDIGKISGDMIDQMSEIIWILNNIDDTVASFVSHTRIYIADYIARTQIQLNFDIINNAENYHLSGTQRRNLLLVIKESFHNVVKHSQATMLTIHFSSVESKLIVVIKDNGIGFPEKIMKQGNGINNIKKRIKAINGAVQFNTKEGTQVIIEISKMTEISAPK